MDGLRAALTLLGAVAAAGCAQSGDARTPSAAARGTGAAVTESRGVVDSAISVDEGLRRFRAGTRSVTKLEGGATSRDRLVRDFVQGLERGDSAALRRLELDRAEFAFLYYPFTIHVRPPYEQQPEVVWLLLRLRGDTGLRRLVERHGGRSLAFRGYACDSGPAMQGENRVWRDCVVKYRTESGATARGRLFGAIVERGGRYKFVSYANDL